MLDHAEIGKVPPAPKQQIRKPAPPAQSANATTHFFPTDRTSELLDIKNRLQANKIPPKITLYDRFIFLPEDLPVKLMEIIKQAAQTHSVSINMEQLAAVQKSLAKEIAPTPKLNPDSKELLTILFNEMTINGIPLESASFVNEIKKGCKHYAEQHLKVQRGQAPNEVSTFLSQWSTLTSESNPNFSFDMGRGVLTDYQYENIADVMPLLSIDGVSTTKDSETGEKRRSAANLVLDQVNRPLTSEQLRQILLELNKIYSSQKIMPYKQGFRYHSAQIGQGGSAIGTTSATEVENSVDQVINQITTTLEKCESQYKEGTISLDNMLKTVIDTSAMAYQLLISIHPFADGNGRTCRMFANYILMHYHLLPATFSAEDAKLSMYDDNNLLERNNTEFPKKARAAIINALTRSFACLHPQ